MGEAAERARPWHHVSPRAANAAYPSPPTTTPTPTPTRRAGNRLRSKPLKDQRRKEKTGRLVFSRECEKLLTTIGDWGLNIFSLDQLACGRQA